jgi:hypothetical protein
MVEGGGSCNEGGVAMVAWARRWHKPVDGGVLLGCWA